MAEEAPLTYSSDQVVEMLMEASPRRERNMDRKADLELADAAAEALISQGKVSPGERVLVRHLMREFASERISEDEFEEMMQQIVSDEPTLDPSARAELAAVRELTKFWVRRIGWCFVLVALVVGVTMRLWKRR